MRVHWQHFFLETVRSMSRMVPLLCSVTEFNTNQTAGRNDFASQPFLFGKAQYGFFSGLLSSRHEGCHVMACILLDNGDYTCQSSVVCVMCPHLMFPYLVCFLSLFNVIISSCMSSRVCLIIYDLPVYISSCLFSLMLSGLLFIPGVSCLWVLPCPIMSCLDVLIKYYHLSLYPRPRVPVPHSCVHRDNTLTRAH